MSDHPSGPPPAGPMAADPPPIPSTSSLAPPAPAATLRPARRSPARVPFYAHAAQPEIVRANQKDVYYLRELADRVEDVARSWLGPRWLQAWSAELGQGSKLAYFGLTTLVGKFRTQTLGEEYVDVVQYSTKSRRLPSQRRRLVLVLLHVLTPYLLSRLYSHLRRQLIARQAENAAAATEAANLDSLFASSQNKLPPPQPKSIADRMKDWLAARAEAGPSFEQLTEDYLRSVHLAVFYLWGRYYQISKRLAGVRYISTQPGRSAASPSAAQTSPAPSSYEVLGFLMAAQLAVRGLLALRRHRAAALADEAAKAAAAAEPSADGEKEAQADKPSKVPFAVDDVPLKQATFDPDDPNSGSAYPDEDGEDARERRCTLCLGPRRDPTATECGHLFCWECIVGWAREKAECPLCRQGIKLNRLLPIHNL